LKTYPLRMFVKRVLLIRLAVVTIGVALMGGATAYILQQQQIEKQVVDLGRQAISTLTVQVAALMKYKKVIPVEALRQVLSMVPEYLPDYRSGHFVFAQFYDPSGTIFAEASAPEPRMIETLKALVNSQPLSFPAAELAEAQTLRNHDGFLVFFVLPVADSQAGAKGYARGIFAISAETATEMRTAVLRSVLIVVSIVFGVTAILYPVILRLTHRLADYSTHLLGANLETLAVLGSAIAKRDADTDAHNYRVSLYAARLAEKIGLGAKDMRALIKGSFIHDVGKIGIPDGVLHKPGPLNEEEYRVMQTHVGMGVDIVRRAAWLRDSVPVVAAHHEKFGGGGYPQGARADDIPLVARIFAIADVFDALTSKRPYKNPLGFEETMQILHRGRGVHFDPELLDAFDGIAAELHQKYSADGGEDLRQELDALVGRYFSAGMESLHYGGLTARWAPSHQEFNCRWSQL
jgi:HD-GYP domain-containing protein (c-di-GMP phosphodiesterase class II)